jgi:hypothetical protein
MARPHDIVRYVAACIDDEPLLDDFARRSLISSRVAGRLRTRIAA